MIKIKTEKLDFARRVEGLETTAELARAMSMNSAAVGRTLAGKRGVGPEFVTGLQRAFPRLSFEDLLEVVDEAVPA